MKVGILVHVDKDLYEAIKEAHEQGFDENIYPGERLLHPLNEIPYRSVIAQIA